MMWLVLCVLILAKDSGGQRSELAATSEADSGGAATASGFSGLDPAKLPLSGVVSELKRAFEVTRMRIEGQENDLISVVLRLLGIDSGKVKDLAFDGIVSLVHLLGQILVKDGRDGRTGRKARRDLPLFHFILRQPQVAGLLKQMRDPELVDTLLNESRDRLKNSEEDAECILVLLCKTSPFVRGMQRSLEFFMRREALLASATHPPPTTPTESAHVAVISGGDDACPGGRGGEERASWEKADVEGRMYFFLPSLEEVAAHGDECDQLFPNCVY